MAWGIVAVLGVLSAGATFRFLAELRSPKMQRPPGRDADAERPAPAD